MGGLIESPEPRQVCCHVQLFATPWTIACQAPLSVEFSRQEHWSGLPLPTPGDLPVGTEPVSLASPALAGRFFTTEPPGKLHGVSNPSSKSIEFGAGLSDALNQGVCWEMGVCMLIPFRILEHSRGQDGVGSSPRLETGLTLPAAPLSLHSVPPS